MKNIRGFFVWLTVLGFMQGYVLTDFSYALDSISGNQNSNLPLSSANPQSNSNYQNVSQSLTDPAAFIEVYSKNFPGMRITGKVTRPGGPTSVIMTNSLQVEKGAMSLLVFEVDAQLNVKFTAAIYNGISIFKLDFNVLHSAVSAVVRDMDTVRLMSELTIQDVDDSGTVYFSLLGKSVKAFKDSNGVAQAQIDLPPTVKNYLDDLKSKLFDYDVKLTLTDSKKTSLPYEISITRKNQEGLQHGDFTAATYYLNDSLNKQLTRVEFKGIEESTGYNDYLLGALDSLPNTQDMNEVRMTQIRLDDRNPASDELLCFFYKDESFSFVHREGNYLIKNLSDAARQHLQDLIIASGGIFDVSVQAVFDSPFTYEVRMVVKPAAALEKGKFNSLRYRMTEDTGHLLKLVSGSMQMGYTETVVDSELIYRTAKIMAPASSTAYVASQMEIESVSGDGSMVISYEDDSYYIQKNGDNDPLITKLSLVQSGMSAHEIVNVLMLKGYFTQQQYTEFLDGLSFEEVFDSYDQAELLNLFIQGGILKDNYADTASLKQALYAKGVDIDALQLRGDGILQALGNPAGGSLLKYAPTDVNAVIKAKQDLTSNFSANKESFLNIFSPENLLGFFGAVKTVAEAPVLDPIFGLAKFIRTSEMTGLDYMAKAYNPNDLIGSNRTEPQILAALSNPANIAKAASQINKMPAGAHVLYIGGAMLYDLYDENGKYIPSEFDVLKDTNGNILRDAYGNPLYGPWMDGWEATVEKRMDTFMKALKQAGVTIDYVMIDYEEKTGANYEINGQNYEPDPARPGKVKRKPGPSVWEAIMQDYRWPALRAEMGITDEQLRAGLDKNGNLMGGSDNLNAMGQLWNITQERMRLENFSKAIYEPSAAYYSKVLLGSYEDGFRIDTDPNGHNDFRFTNMWGGLGGMDVEGLTGFLPSENLRSYDYTNTPNGNIYPANTSFGELQGIVSVTRANAQASALQSLHWITGPDFYDPKNYTVPTGDINVLPYYAELMFHTALNGADQIFLQTSGWSTKQGQDYTNAILEEMNDPNLFAYSDRETITLDNVSFNDKFLVSGMRANGKLVYRVSWESGSLSSVLKNDGSNGQPLTFQIGDSRVEIPGGSIYVPEGGDISSYGTWVIVDDLSVGKLLDEDISLLLNPLN